MLAGSDSIRGNVQDSLASFPGLQWMLTSITGRHQMVNHQRGWVPVLNVLVGFTPTTTSNDDFLRNILHDADLIADNPSFFKTTGAEKREEALEKDLYEMCKDHRTVCVRDLINASNRRWIERASWR